MSVNKLFIVRIIRKCYEATSVYTTEFALRIYIRVSNCALIKPNMHTRTESRHMIDLCVEISYLIPKLKPDSL